METSYGVLYHRTRKDYLKNIGLPDEPESYKNWTDVDWLQINTGQADIHMMALAEAMWDAYNEGAPKLLAPDEWHIPFGDRINDRALTEGVMGVVCGPGEFLSKESLYTAKQLKLKIAVARCARISYTVFGEEDKPDNYEADIKLHDRLAASGHWSPFEHIAQVMDKGSYITHLCGTLKGEYGFNAATGNVNMYTNQGSNQSLFGWSGNLRGFIQYRKTFSNENITK